MPRYSKERKAAVLKKLLPPNNQSVSEVAQEEGISEPTLYNWRIQARAQGVPVPSRGKQTDDWSAEAKFAVLVETATLNEAELSEYCRSKGLYPEQVRSGKTLFMDGVPLAGNQQRQKQRESKQDKKRIKELERELKRKEKALAEAAALLVLRKKWHALWEESEEA